MDDRIWIVIAFIMYLGIMLAIGFRYYGRTKNSEEYFLGGRKLSGWVAALSAQASDMSGWLLMGLPGAIYALGTGQIWIAVGLALGTAINWIFIAARLRRYTIVAGNALTLPEYFQNRFHDTKGILKIASSLFIMIFFLVYTASAFSAGAQLFQTIFGIEYTYALIIGAVVILSYTFLGGFMAVCWTDFIQGLLMLFAILIVPAVALNLMGGLGQLNSAGTAPHFLNPLYNGGERITAVSLISQFAWALGYLGMPHILVRFMAIKNNREVKKSRVIAITWVILSLGAACAIGVIGRAFLPNLGADDKEKVFISMILEIFKGNPLLLLIGGILLCGVLAAIMSTADSQLLVTASSISQDLYKGVVNKNASDKSLLRLSRIVTVAVAAIAFCIALDPKSSVMDLVSNAWAGFGATFGPVVLLSLFWKRGNKIGAAFGMVGGGLTVIIWDYIKFGGATLAASTGLYSLLPGFLVGLVAFFVVSLLTKEPEDVIQKEFALVASGNDVEIDKTLES